LVYFAPEMIAAAEDTYGKPATYTMSYPASSREMDIVRASQKNGRKHDITMAIFGARGVIVIAKPWYTRGLYRLPSGGLVPDEPLKVGAAREAKEETGVTMELVRYHLRIDVNFVGDDGAIPWTSHVFSARHVAGEIEPEDTEEIREARWCKVSELLQHRELMLKSTVSGLNYRADLQDTFLDDLESRGWLTRNGSELHIDLNKMQ
jgi:8-oxo-dGTP pyrophosphatase MutT (NUDIX family)